MLGSTLLAQVDFKNTFGTIAPPAGVVDYNTQAGGGADPNAIGIILFISTIIKLVTIIAGIWVLFNFVSAGFTYVTSAGDSGAQNKVRDQLTMSVLGLVIMVMAYTIAAILSAILFHDPAYFLNPTITGPTP